MFEKLFQKPIFTKFAKNKIRKTALQSVYNNCSKEDKVIFEKEFKEYFYDENFIGVNIFTCPFHFKSEYSIDKRKFKKGDAEGLQSLKVGLGFIAKVIDYKGQPIMISNSNNVIHSENYQHLIEHDPTLLQPGTYHFIYFDNEVIVPKTKEFINRLQSKQKIAKTDYHLSYLKAHLKSSFLGRQNDDRITLGCAELMDECDGEFYGHEISYVDNGDGTMSLHCCNASSLEDQIFKVKELASFLNKNKDAFYESDLKLFNNFLEKNDLEFDEYITVRVLSCDNGMKRIGIIF